MEFDQSIVSQKIQFFLSARGWNHSKCSECGRAIYEKSSGSHEPQACDHSNQTTLPSYFLGLSKKKVLVSHKDLSEAFEQFFTQRGYGRVPALKMQGTSDKTDLVIAGVQVYDEVFHHGKAPFMENLIILQPSVRMRFKDSVGVNGGTSTAFINFCTESLSQSIDDFLESFDHWIAFLSSVGLFAGDLVLVEKPCRKNWGTGEFLGVGIHVLYGGLEIGHAMYALIPTMEKQTYFLSDIGFGLERVLWAINKTEDYFGLLIPLTSQISEARNDSLRSATLLVAGGVIPSSRGAGSHLRKFCKDLSEATLLDWRSSIETYFDYWSYYIDAVFPIEEVVKIIALEIDRHINLRICQTFNFPSPQQETTESYANRLVYQYGLSVEEVRTAIVQCLPLESR